MPPTSETLCTLLRFELDSALRILENVNQNLRSYGYSLPVTNADLNKVGQQASRALRIVQDLRSAIDAIQRTGSPLPFDDRDLSSRIIVDFDSVNSDGLIMCSLRAVPTRLLMTPEVAIPCEDGMGRSALVRIIRIDERRFTVWLRIVDTTVLQSEPPAKRYPIQGRQIRR